MCLSVLLFDTCHVKVETQLICHHKNNSWNGRVKLWKFRKTFLFSQVGINVLSKLCFAILWGVCHHSSSPKLYLLSECVLPESPSALVLWFQYFEEKIRSNLKDQNPTSQGGGEAPKALSPFLTKSIKTEFKLTLKLTKFLIQWVLMKKP